VKKTTPTKTTSPPPAVVRQAPGRPKDLAKRDAILDAAKRLFAAAGLDGTSMDAVAREAGVSKLTVYSHFSDKDALFKEAVRSKCEEQMPEALFHVDPKATIGKQLLGIARGFHDLVFSEESLALHRMMISSASHSPHLAGLFFEAGPMRVLAAFEQFLKEAVRAGSLEVRDPRMAAGHFFVLIKGMDHMRQLVGYSCFADPGNDGGSRDRHLKSVVDLFLRAYQPR